MDLSNIKKIKQQDLIIEWMRGNEGKEDLRSAPCLWLGQLMGGERTH